MFSCRLSSRQRSGNAQGISIRQIEIEVPESGVVRKNYSPLDLHRSKTTGAPRLCSEVNLVHSIFTPQAKKSHTRTTFLSFSSFQYLDRLGPRGDMSDDSAEIILQSFLQEAIVNSSGMGREVHSLTLSIQHFLCPPWCRSPSKVP